MIRVLQGKRILLGVTGSIAAYKAAQLASQLTQGGAQVDVIMTREAIMFVTPMTFEALTHRHVVTDVMELLPDSQIGHVAMAKHADVFLIAPVTAHMIAKLAHGLADDAVSATVLDTRAPIVLAPAMETDMWQNKATQENVGTLESRGVVVVAPGVGRLASGASGPGRLADLDNIVDTVRAVLGRTGDLAHRKVVVTAGGTQEALDPVRVLTNQSSGKMGFALAEAARDRGANVTLIAGVTQIRMPQGVTCICAPSAQEMHDAVLHAIPDAHALIMAAAVADFRPAHEAKEKIKKAGTGMMTLELVRTPDILRAVAQWKRIADSPGSRPLGSPENSRTPPRLLVVGFAAETHDLLGNAKAKLEDKDLDLIVANPVPKSFGSDLDQATLVARDGTVTELAPTPKQALAETILDFVVSRLKDQSGA